MDPERWKRIDEIFHATIDRDPSEREAFLADLCKEDDLLRAEVEALIISHEEESSLFEKPAADLAAEFLNREGSFKGAISHYKILNKIGSGGMGEVYLAEDTRLHRKVALKLLPLEFTTDKERVRRFEREARTVTALNHPNIITIYDYGQVDSSSFIVSEFIDGETLRHKIQTPGMSTKEILGIIIQVAEALDAAHKAGIVHRDIKPENIMLRHDGYIKVLDFGLSKPSKQKNMDESYLETISKTQDGLVLGTIRYMSPEQARGLDVDSRSDIFSVGVLLYEMISRRNPFDAATPQDILVAILERNPPPLESNSELPEELHWIMEKALAKDPEERYQSAKELITDLKRIQKQLEFEKDFKSSGKNTLVSPVTKTKWTPMVVVLVLVFLAALAFILTRPKRQEITTAPKPFSKIKLTRLTSSGSIYGGVISLDGRYAAYVEGTASGQQSLYLKQLNADTEIKILTLPPKNFFYRPRQRNNAIRFSPDGEYIYYLSSLADKDIRALHRIPVLGGISQKLIEDIDMIPSFSPDGKKLAFPLTVKDEVWIMIAQADGSDQRKIRADKFPLTYYEDIEWSPDGRLLASIKSIQASDTSSKQIVGISLNDFSERTLFDSKLVSDIWQDDLEWLSDGSGLILTKSVEGERQIYQMSIATGEATSVTNDLNDYTGVSLTRDNKNLITTQRVPNWTIWTASTARPNDMTQLTSGSIIEDGARGLSWTPDGKIIYQSKEPSGEFQLWEINADGTNRTRITTGKADKQFPVCTTDGRYIVYGTDEGELSKVWRMDRDGANPKLLSGTRLARWINVSPDSKWALYSTFGGTNQQLIKVQLDGRQETLLASHNTVYGAAISPNGSQIAYVYIDNQKSPELVLSIMSSNGGRSLKSFQLPQDTFPGRFQWTHHGDGIAYILSEIGRSNIHVQPLDGSSARRLTNLTDHTIVNFAWSQDGKQIAFSRGKRSSDLVLIQNVP